MGGETDRPDWGEGGEGSGRAGAPHSEPKGEWKPIGDPAKGAQRYSGPLEDLEHGEQQPPAELEHGEQHEPANPLTVTAEERREIVEGIEARAAPPTEYADLPASTRELLDQDAYDNVVHEIGGAREHLNHEDYDKLDAAIEGLPKALNEKLLVALGSGEFKNAQEIVEHLADGLPAKQMVHLRRAIDELPKVVRDGIDIRDARGLRDEIDELPERMRDEIEI